MSMGGVSTAYRALFLRTPWSTTAASICLIENDFVLTLNLHTNLRVCKTTLYCFYLRLRIEFSALYSYRKVDHNSYVLPCIVRLQFYV